MRISFAIRKINKRLKNLFAQKEGDFEGRVAAGKTHCFQTVSHWNLLIVLETIMLLQGWDWHLVTASASLMYF